MSMFINQAGLELFRTACAIIIVLCQRYLLEIGHIAADLRWLRRQKWFYELTRLRYYRGLEWLRQVQAWQLLEGV